ncbi:MAG: hypothetical protein HYX42_05680 [Polaromonas sp.]|uniref:hypothetical protein n=1 Tax=Polaromonas sp. TaxID=1869339 RepID=UPI0025EA4191|nr:hypothetical protein [Polaromonas sp.]MBI2725724.1 hypothetical protein [Polaromonas sp.]
MDNIIVYVDDASYALQMLQPMHTDGVSRNPARWIVVGCAPRVTHRASKWVTNSARESWRGKWAEKTFARLLPLLEQNGDTVITKLAQTTLCAQTESLMKEYGVARVLDARRPKFGQDMQPVTQTQVQESKGALGYVTALAGAGLLVAID